MDLTLFQDKRVLMIIIIGAGAAVITISGLLLIKPLPEEMIQDQSWSPLAEQGEVIEQPTCIPNWSCTNWTPCTEELTQTRQCIDVNNCEGVTGRPQTSRYCEPQVIQEEEPYLLSTIKLTTGLKHLISFNESTFNATFIDYELINQDIEPYRVRYELCFKDTNLTSDELLMKELLCEGVIENHDYDNWKGVIIAFPSQLADVLINDNFKNLLVCTSETNSSTLNSTAINQSISSLKKVCEWASDNIKELIMRGRGLIEPGVKFFEFNYRGSLFNLTTRNYLTFPYSLNSTSQNLINAVDLNRFFYDNCTSTLNKNEMCEELRIINHSGWWGLGYVYSLASMDIIIIHNETHYFNDEFEKNYLCSSKDLSISDLEEVCNFLVDNFNDESYNTSYDVIETPYGFNDLISGYGINASPESITYITDNSTLNLNLKVNFSESIEIIPGEFVDFDNISPNDFTMHLLDLTNDRLIAPLNSDFKSITGGYNYAFSYLTPNVLNLFQAVFHYKQAGYNYLNANTSPIAFNANIIDVEIE